MEKQLGIRGEELKIKYQILKIQIKNKNRRERWMMEEMRDKGLAM
jgi:hypothetical protein